MSLSHEDYVKKFKIKKGKDGHYRNLCASNWHGVDMAALQDLVEGVGGFQVKTPPVRGNHRFQLAKSTEEVWWWWKWKRRVFQSATSDFAVGAKMKKWTIVSQRCAHVLHA